MAKQKHKRCKHHQSKHSRYPTVISMDRNKYMDERDNLEDHKQRRAKEKKN